MKKLLVLQGIPGSGKTHWCRNFIKDKSKEWIIVNRDSIRESLGEYWVPSREKLVTEIEYFMIHAGLKNNYNVIIDATNINPKTINKLNSLADLYDDVEIEFKRFNIILEEAIKRDKNRKRTVGEKVIRNFYGKWVKEK